MVIIGAAVASARDRKSTGGYSANTGRSARSIGVASSRSGGRRGSTFDSGADAASTASQVEIAKPAGDTLSGATVSTIENANAARGPKTARKDKESSAEAAARKEKERKAAEARRLLNQ